MTNTTAGAEILDEEQPDQVFHFTSMNAFMNIVETQSLRCTAISYLNDSTERSYLLNAVRKRLPDLQQKDGSVYKGLDLQNIDVDDVNVVTPLANEAFVTSFTESGDSLMHWQSYCPKESGIAIGFRSNCLSLARIDEKPAPGMVVPWISFTKIGYFDVNIQTVVDMFINYAHSMARKGVDKSKGDINEYFKAAIKTLACICKHDAFQVEGEFRLLLSDVRYRENNIKFRPVRSTLIPYVPLRIPGQTTSGYSFDMQTGWSAIKSVVIGPTPNMDLTEKSVKAFFAIRAMDVQVVRSKIPYRDW
jgi:hypothetical protein